MAYKDRQVLFTALGFLAIIMSGKSEKKDAAIRAQIMAGYIESFCREKVPEAFPAMQENYSDDDLGMIDQMIAYTKHRISSGQDPKLPQVLELKVRLYHRLQMRQRLFMTDALIGEEILRLLEQDKECLTSEEKMMILSVTGDPHAFEPYERMATAIVDILKDKGKCTRADIQPKGFSAQEIERCWNTAFGLAHIDLMKE